LLAKIGFFRLQQNKIKAIKEAGTMRLHAKTKQGIENRINRKSAGRDVLRF
jgi:hypothetical protein